MGYKAIKFSPIITTTHNSQTHLYATISHSGGGHFMMTSCWGRDTHTHKTQNNSSEN